MKSTSQRAFNWGASLATYLNAAQSKPFKWGSHDCVTLAFGAVEAITGQPLKPLPCNPWATLRQGIQISQTYNPIDWLQQAYGATLVQPHFQQRGDIGFIKEQSYWKGVVFNGRYAASLGMNGLVFYEANELIKLDGLQVVRLPA